MKDKGGGNVDSKKLRDLTNRQTDRQTNEETFVNVESLLQLKIVSYSSVVEKVLVSNILIRGYTTHTLA